MNTSDHAPARGSDCERHADALAALVDEALDPRERRALDEHLADCRACCDLLADLRVIRSLAATLDPVEPPAQVWRAIRRRIATTEPTPVSAPGWHHGWSRRGAALAAAAAMAAFLLVVGPVDLPRPPAATGSAGPAARAAAAALEAIERPHAAAIRELERRIGNGAPLPAPARAVLTRNLALVEDAIAESRAAAAADPAAAIARQRLRAGLTHKLTLLRTMAALEVEGG